MAAVDYFAAGNALLDELTLKIKDITIGPSDKLGLMCLNRFDKRKVYGEGLEAILKFRTGYGGTRGRASKGASFSMGGEPLGIEGKFGIKKQTLTFEFDDEDLRKMEGGRKGLQTTVEEEVTGGLEGFKLNQERLMYGDGSGVVGRAEGNPDNVAYCSFGPGPCLAIEDDVIEFVLNRGTVAESGGEGAGVAELRVIDVDHAAKVIYFKTAIATAVADNECMALANGMIDQDTPGAYGSGTKFTAYPHGFAAALNHFGDDADGTLRSVWDTDNASEYYVVENYNGLIRTTAANRKMLCGHKAAANAPVDLYWISYGPSALAGKGVPTSKMLLLMSVREYNRIVSYWSGASKTLDSANVILPGGKVKLPVITAGGQADIPIIASPFMLDGAIATIELGDWEQLYTGSGGFIPGTNGKFHLRPVSGTYEHVWQAMMPVYHNTTCMYPYRQFLVSGLDLTDG